MPLTALVREYIWRPRTAPIPWSPVIGLVRSLIAVGTLMTLTFSSTDSLFRRVVGSGQFPTCHSVEAFGVFCVFGDAHLLAAKILCIVILLAVVSGVVPQITSILHFWVAFSVNTGIAIPDGGDQISSNLTLLLIPLCLTDPRINHWIRTRTPTRFLSARLSIATATLIALKAQLVILYFYSSTGKMYHEEWAEGTAMYYIFSGPFGPAGFVKDLGAWFVSIPLFGFIVAWGALLIELLLAVSPLTPVRFRFPIFALGICLHSGIAVLMGLWSFQAAMFASVMLLTLPLTARVYQAGWSLRRLGPIWRWFTPPPDERSPADRSEVLEAETSETQAVHNEADTSISRS